MKPYFSPEVSSLLKKLLERNPKKRLGCGEGDGDGGGGGGSSRGEGRRRRRLEKKYTSS